MLDELKGMWGKKSQGESHITRKKSGSTYTSYYSQLWDVKNHIQDVKKAEHHNTKTIRLWSCISVAEMWLGMDFYSLLTSTCLWQKKKKKREEEEKIQR